MIDGLSAANFTIEIDSPDGGRGAISGFQIIAADALSPSITTFEADDYYVQPNDPVQLSWQVTGDETLILNPGNMDVSGMTEITLNPTESTTFTLTVGLSLIHI